MAVNVPEALATRPPIPLVPIACEGSHRWLAHFRPELEQGNPSSCALGLVISALAIRLPVGLKDR